VNTEDTAGTTIVDRAWVQSWLTSTARQDRAAYQLTTNRRDLDVTLPEGAAAAQAIVLVDGKLVEYQAVGGDRLLIPLSGHREGRSFTIELRYHFPEARSPNGALAMEFPHIGYDAWIRRMYWQLVLPANEHLMDNPVGFTGEFNWQWQGYFWGRQPLFNQEQLESWVGVGSRPALPEQANIYLFSTLGNVQQAEVHIAGRTWIVLLASGAALVAGLLLIYVPASRHPAVLLIVAVVLLATGLIAPEPTLLLAQAASLGLVLTLLAGLLERGVARRRHRTIPRKESTSALVELGSTRTPLSSPLIDAHASTEILPTVQPQATENADR
jgi:hypothetical protein